MVRFLVFYFSLLILTHNTLCSDFKFTILSWNLFLIPKPINFTLQNQREKLILKKLEEFNADIVLLQEVFTSSSYQFLSSSLKSLYPYSTHLRKKEKFFQLLSSGLVILSKYPLKIIDQVIYDNCSGVDCFSAKGFIFAEARVSADKIIQIGNTHLQAQDGEKKFRTRIKQIKSIKKSLEKYLNPNLDQILAGDFNIVYQSSEYEKLISVLNLNPAYIDSQKPFTTAADNTCYHTPDKNKGLPPVWIDYFLITKTSPHIKLHSIEVLNSDGILGSQNCPLSDHFPILGTFIYE